MYTSVYTYKFNNTVTVCKNKSIARSYHRYLQNEKTKNEIAYYLTLPIYSTYTIDVT